MFLNKLSKINKRFEILFEPLICMVLFPCSFDFSSFFIVLLSWKLDAGSWKFKNSVKPQASIIHLHYFSFSLF
ncbi:hypothetical protein ACFP3I_23115 [Chryseobacterium arachidis]|uniref:hypothetical protein n=1 Tax=Chryseobacterium arachidis TaxID=1416778 RepID=UPI0036124B08